MKSSKVMFVLLCLAAVMALSCSPLSTAANAVANQVVGSGFRVVDQLWTDVPRMDGMTSAEQDVPIWVKLYVQTVLRAMSGGEGSVDWIVFTTKKTPSDIEAYYTLDRMGSQGWDTQGQDTACLSGSEQGVSEAGLICVFEKQGSNKQDLLAIMAGTDTTTNQTDILKACARGEFASGAFCRPTSARQDVIR
jgi:hypothetical protein